jgi:GIY-YIG catalytic domain
MPVINQVYWIRHKNHNDLFTQGYIGVTSNFKERIRQHFKNSKGGYHTDKSLSQAINKYGKDQIIVENLLFGDSDYCYQIEKQLRPKAFIGWNMREGGYHTPNPFPKGSKMPKWIVQKANQTKKAKRLAGINAGSDRKVLVNGVLYNTVKSARESHGISITQMKRLLNGASGGYKFGHLKVEYASC